MSEGIGGEVATWYHRFDLKYRLGDLRGSSTRGACLLRLTDSPVLLTAPHTVTTMRNGREKAAEFWSGALTETLGELLNANVVTALSPRIESPHASSSDAFLDTVEMVTSTRDIRLVVDVHGIRADRDIDLNVGTAGAARADPHAQLVRDFVEALGADFVVTIDSPFSGGAGVAGYLNSRGALAAGLALQLECGARLRRDVIDERDVHRLAEAIADLSAALASPSPR